MKLYAVVDKKAKSIVSVFSSSADESAKRSFLSLLTGPQNIFTDFPEDFSLFAIADLSCSGYTLTVCRPGSECLLDHGFKADHFILSEPVDEGSNYSKITLKSLHDERLSYSDVIENEEDSEDE